MSLFKHKVNRGRRGFTLPELMVAAGVMGILAYGTSMIYFSVLKIYNQQIWRFPPYDAATAAVARVSDEMRDAMLIEEHGPDYIVCVMPLKDANRENVLTLGPDGYQLNQGDRVEYYLSDQTGSLEVAGNCLWKAVKAPGADSFTPRVRIADNIHPEMNPTDPDTGQPRAMFKYWPDDVRLWGVEVWMTSTAQVHGQMNTQTAHSESYLRNK
jgi:prepilin-type N-terminal cleavage/methylation domain-containing protein